MTIITPSRAPSAAAVARVSLPPSPPWSLCLRSPVNLSPPTATSVAHPHVPPIAAHPACSGGVGFHSRGCSAHPYIQPTAERRSGGWAHSRHFLFHPRDACELSWAAHRDEFSIRAVGPALRALCLAHVAPRAPRVFFEYFTPCAWSAVRRLSLVAVSNAVVCRTSRHWSSSLHHQCLAVPPCLHRSRRQLDALSGWRRRLVGSQFTDDNWVLIA
jgi:hypothetical protein